MNERPVQSALTLKRVSTTQKRWKPPIKRTHRSIKLKNIYMCILTIGEGWPPRAVGLPGGGSDEPVLKLTAVTVAQPVIPQATDAMAHFQRVNCTLVS